MGRNDPCLCGSGLKFKKCCVFKKIDGPKNHTLFGQTQGIVPKSIYPFHSDFLLMPSIEWKGYRLRFLFNRVYYYPPVETFHDFLFRVIKLTFGKKWSDSQKGMPSENKHIVCKWFEKVHDFRKNFIPKNQAQSSENGVVFFTKVDGSHQALLSLGWDLYCLQAKNKLPENVQKKLIKNTDFQSFRYEISVAAIMVRAGFDIEWYDISGRNGKKSEFIATNIRTGQKVTVEAKSLHRDGSVHEKGILNLKDDKESVIAQRLKAAEEKKESGIPHLIFIDVNRPPDPQRNESDIDYLKSIIIRMPKLSKEKPAKHEALFLTNFVPYYGGVGDPVPNYQYFPVIPMYCTDQLDLNFYNDIFLSLDAYSFIPDQI